MRSKITLNEATALGELVLKGHRRPVDSFLCATSVSILLFAYNKAKHLSFSLAHAF